MTQFFYQLKRTTRLRTRWVLFCTTPQLYRERFKYALRRAMWPEVKLQIWVTSPATGTRFFLCDDPIDDAIAQDIVKTPGKIYPSPSLLEQVEGVILDVGGHHGLYAAEALRRYPGRKIIVVEPHPLWCELIKKNLAENGGTARSRVVNACLATDRGRRTLCFDPDSSWGATVLADDNGCATVEVESLPLLDILQGESVAMIYCNAEGAEYTLVPQLQQAKLRPAALVICVHPEYGDAQALRSQVREMGYSERDASPNPNRPVYHYSRRSS